MADDPKIVLLDDEERKHQQQVANNLTDALNVPHHVSNVAPASTQTPVVQVDDSASSDGDPIQRDESELEDVIRGFRGKSRTAPAAGFLNEKMKWLSKKNKGAKVTLK